MKDSKKVPALIPYYIPEKNIGKFVLSVIHRLESKSFATYIVGGFIRDHALDLNPKDIDLVSEATPSQIKKCFRNARVIGKRFRLVHLYGPDGSILELSTFRKTPSQKDLEEVRKTRFISKVREKHLANNIYGDAGEDAQRRDFTVNAILYSPTRKVIVDYTGGFKDLNKKRIEMIGNVKDRFLEDPVRIIRACKLSGKQGLTMPNNIANSIRGQVKLIADVPRSRLYEEFLKILKSGYSLTILKKLKRFGVLKVWLPVIQRCLSKGSPLYNVLEAIDSAILSGKNELYDDHILGLVSLLCFAIDEKDSYFNTANLQNKQLYLFSEFGVFQKKRFALVIYQAAVFMCAPELFISVEGKNLFKVMRGELGGQVVETLRYLSEAKIIKPSAFHYWEDYMNSLKRPKSFRRKKRH